jgi:hypothetical protein
VELKIRRAPLRVDSSPCYIPGVTIGTPSIFPRSPFLDKFRFADDSPATERWKAFAITDRLSDDRDDDLATMSARAKMTKGFPRFTQLIKDR